MKYQKLTLAAEPLLKKIKCKKDIENGLEELVDLYVLSMLQQQINPIDSADTRILMEEHYWAASGRNVIFLEDEKLIDAILSSQVTINENVIGAICPPQESFCLILPKNYKTPDGIGLSNMVVSWMSHYDNATKIIRPHISKAINQDDDGSYYGPNRNEQYLSVTTKNVYDNSNLQLNCFEREFEDIVSNLNHATPSEIEEFFTKNRVEEINEALNQSPIEDDIDKKIKKAAIKLILGLAIYLQAGGNIYSGIPKKAKAEARKSSANYLRLERAQTISLPSNFNNNSGLGYVRGFHFRNLQHEKYYKNEFANIPQGSRWTFVNPCWVGEKISPETTN